MKRKRGSYTELAEGRGTAITETVRGRPRGRAERCNKIRKCVASKGLTDAFFGCVARKGLRGALFVSMAGKGVTGFLDLGGGVGGCRKARRKRRNHHEISIT